MVSVKMVIFARNKIASQFIFAEKSAK